MSDLGGFASWGRFVWILIKMKALQEYSCDAVYHTGLDGCNF